MIALSRSLAVSFFLSLRRDFSFDFFSREPSGQISSNVRSDCIHIYIYQYIRGVAGIRERPA